ncbi:uncharacterized protein LOC127264408 [Andrographis paniculata]|uniref:uncharacterized protein LOC127264408 n=1 Tax=Andrographis paniculata TaxID=175694 RepID=UPI0021E75742|nr:uncharacterized protein LOC127264408 [Andrographis paniculata]
MDEGMGKAADIEEWMKEFMPDVAADAAPAAGMGRGAVTMPPSNLSNSNQQIRPTSLAENYPVPPAITTNNSPGMWQHSQRPLDGPNNPVRQNMTSNLPALFEEFSQSQASRNMISKLHQQQQLQNQVLGQVAERPNMYQFRVPSNPYANNLRQHPQQQTSVGGYATPHINAVQQTDQTTLQKCLEQRGYIAESMHPRIPMPAFHQSQNLALINQMKAGNQSQTMHLGQSQAVSETNSPADLANLDWINQAFQKLLQIKDTYLPDVIMLYKKSREERPRATAAEISRYEKTKNFAEKLYKFMNLSKNELLNYRKDKVFQMLDDAVKQCMQIRAMFSNGKPAQQAESSNSQLEAPQMQQRENYYQFNCPPATLQQQQQQQSLRQTGALNLPESSVNSPKVDAPSMANAIQYGNTMRTAAQKWGSHGNMVPSPTQKSFDQRSLRMLLHPPDSGTAQHMNMGTPHQQMIPSPRNVYSSLDYSVNPMAPAMIPVSPQNKQQDHAMKRQKMKQPAQQLPPDKNKQQMLQKRNEDTNLRPCAEGVIIEAFKIWNSPAIYLAVCISISLDSFIGTSRLCQESTER